MEDVSVHEQSGNQRPYSALKQAVGAESQVLGCYFVLSRQPNQHGDRDAGKNDEIDFVQGKPTL